MIDKLKMFSAQFVGMLIVNQKTDN